MRQLVLLVLLSLLVAGCRREETKTEKSEAARQALEVDALLGLWDCQSVVGRAILDVRSDSKLILDGSESSYRIVPGGIRVTNGELEFDYEVIARPGELVLSVSGDELMTCKRMKRPPPPAPGRRPPATRAPREAPPEDDDAASPGEAPDRE